MTRSWLPPNIPSEEGEWKGRFGEESPLVGECKEDQSFLYKSWTEWRVLECAFLSWSSVNRIYLIHRYKRFLAHNECLPRDAFRHSFLRRVQKESSILPREKPFRKIALCSGIILTRSSQPQIYFRRSLCKRESDRIPIQTHLDRTKRNKTFSICC